MYERKVLKKNHSGSSLHTPLFSYTHTHTLFIDTDATKSM